MNKRDEKGLSIGGIVLIYGVLIIVIAVMALATLIRYDVIFQDKKNNKDTINDGNVVNDDKNFKMTCTHNRVEGKLRVVSILTFTFEDSNLKHFNGSDSYRLVNSNEGFGALAIQLSSYQYTKEQYEDIDGIKWEIEEGDNSFIATVDVDLGEVKEEQLVDEYELSMSKGLRLNQTIDEVKDIVSENTEISCDK